MPTNLLPIGDLKELWQQAFDEPTEAIDMFFRTGFSPERCRYILRDGKVVCALYWFDCTWRGRPLAYIYALATLPEYRGQGLAGALLEDTHRHLAAKGYYGAVLKPAEGLFPYYERHGYTTCGYICRDTVTCGSLPAPVEELSCGQYAALRRLYLPENSVIQEGDTLAFLYTYARFWKGPGCILCSGRGEPIVYEFLGDQDVLPGVLNSLTIESAAPVRPGGQVPFLMYHPLTSSQEGGPEYLGLAME